MADDPFLPDFFVFLNKLSLPFFVVVFFSPEGESTRLKRAESVGVGDGWLDVNESIRDIAAAATGGGGAERWDEGEMLFEKERGSTLEKEIWSMGAIAWGGTGAER